MVGKFGEEEGGGRQGAVGWNVDLNVAYGEVSGEQEKAEEP